MTPKHNVQVQLSDRHGNQYPGQHQFTTGGGSTVININIDPNAWGQKRQDENAIKIFDKEEDWKKRNQFSQKRLSSKEAGNDSLSSNKSRGNSLLRVQAQRAGNNSSYNRRSSSSS